MCFNNIKNILPERLWNTAARTISITKLMKKSVELSVPVACHEKWSGFVPTAKGGYCSSCEKEVIDFTKWSEEAIKEYFTAKKENLCGRFRKDQLKVYALTEPNENYKKLLPISLFGLTLLGSPSDLHAAEKKHLPIDFHFLQSQPSIQA